MKEIDTTSRQGKVYYIVYCDEYDKWKDIDEDEEFPITKFENLEVPSEATLF